MSEDETAAGQPRVERQTRCRLGEEDAPRAGSILAALRRSPLVGASLDWSREETPGCDVSRPAPASLAPPG
ncbi:hypothetical protein EXY23_13170 [Roseicella aquatilis]|uniref:Uncharacterized protein n=1 Tax=Roseicella aquatilis TaxID=2527868 RepID=A0A4R4DMI4_9PROT|nr:hypothetical protein EXY23_13170 [Roseicella aquatilis]